MQSGWDTKRLYIQYIDRDLGNNPQAAGTREKKKQDLDDEEKTAKFIQEQVRRGLEGKEQVGIIQRCNRQEVWRSTITYFVYFLNRIL